MESLGRYKTPVSIDSPNAKGVGAKYSDPDVIYIIILVIIPNIYHTLLNNILKEIFYDIIIKEGRLSRN